MIKILKISNIIIVVLIALASLLYGELIKAEYQLEIYKMVITISAIIFGVMGAWLSLIKVEVITGIENSKTDSESDFYIRKLRSIVSPMTSSAIILIASLLFVFLYYILKDLPHNPDIAICLKKFSFTTLTILCYWQIYSLIVVLVSGVNFVIDIKIKSANLTADRKRQG